MKIFIPLLMFAIPFMLVHWGTWFCPRAWAGRRVTLITHTNKEAVERKPKRAVRARMKYVAVIFGRSFHTYHEIDSDEFLSDSDYKYCDEGLTWCFGWEGEQVDALRVAAALERVA